MDTLEFRRIWLRQHLAWRRAEWLHKVAQSIAFGVTCSAIFYVLLRASFWVEGWRW